MLQAGVWGAVAAMAMSGMRTLTNELGLVGETPPEAMAREGAGGLLRQIPPAKRGAVVELSHWGFGAMGGVLFGVLPRWVRRRNWAGPVYGLLVWLGFEAGLAPALGLSKAPRRPGPSSARRSRLTICSTAWYSPWVWSGATPRRPSPEGGLLLVIEEVAVACEKSISDSGAAGLQCRPQPKNPVGTRTRGAGVRPSVSTLTPLWPEPD